MNTLRRFAAPALFAATLVGTQTPAAAQGIPVIDVASIAQAIQQVTAWGTQYSQMVTQLQNQLQQLQQAQQTLQNMSGARALGTIANAVGINDLIPANVQSLLQAATTPAALLTQLATLSGASLNATQTRAQQIQTLMAAINGTTDAKGVAEIQARIAAENAAVANDANRVLILDLQQRTEAARINNDIKSANNTNASSLNRINANFTSVFTLGH